MSFVKRITWLLHRRHAVLKLCLPLAAVLSFAIFVTSTRQTTFVRSASGGKPKSFTINPLQELVSSASIASLKTLYGVFIAQAIISIFNILYFFFIWPRRDRINARSAKAAVLGAASVALSIAGLAQTSSYTLSPSDVQSTVANHPGIALEQVESLYADWKAELDKNSKVVLGFSICLGLTQAVAIAFWTWLLPLPWRYPDNYEPVAKPWRRGLERKSSSIEMEHHSRAPVTSGSIAAIWAKHEEAFVRQAAVQIEVSNISDYLSRNMPNANKPVDYDEYKYREPGGIPICTCAA
ncbi:hypothetical protein E8E14_007846 [Neopestalotiopsis sp. 37M]|nr:hypothetical protein E8E14_007846 [Neopestalotiopsis sp. 37M]